MIYLGDQIKALDEYSKEVICWLNIKLKGRLTKKNPLGYSCKSLTCALCNGKGQRKSGLDLEFRNLFTDKIIKDLITAKPHELIKLLPIIEKKYTSIPSKTIRNFKIYCKELFVTSGYTNWFLDNKKNYSLALQLDQHTCTYCNREYIFIYKNTAGGKGMVPQFDHWFSKLDFPLLSLSFYNLIPSCATCNTIKSATPFNVLNHLHPYIDAKITSSYSFSYLPISTTSNQIIFKNKNFTDTKGIDTVNALNLPLIFKGHSSKELQDLIDLKYKYPKNYLNILLKKTFGDVDMSNREKYRLIFGIEIDEKKYHKRTLSKFKNDIIKELLSVDN